MTAIHDTAHHATVDVSRASRRPPVLIAVANPTTSTTTGWRIGFWDAGLLHPLESPGV
jgi:hypothetical protein